MTLAADRENESNAAVAEAAQRWADELIDLGHRNALLHFRYTKTTTLDLDSAAPEAVTRLLAGRRQRLSELFPDPDSRTDVRNRARQLRNRLRALDEEQGIQAGYVAHGLVEWQISDSSRTPAASRVLAPLLLYPVALHARTAAESDYDLEIIGDADLNQVLLHALHRYQGLDSDAAQPVIDGLADTDDPTMRMHTAFSRLASLAAATGAELAFRPATVVGIFSYDKLPMVQDLRNSPELLAGHDVVAAIAGDSSARARLRVAADGGSIGADPDTIAADDEFLVHSADSSQQRVIDSALAGQSLVVKGPPGTGKSQTIANLIAGMAATGRTVLFVAEKRAAIEAVTQRLAQVDLGRLVLDLHDAGTKRKHVAEQLAATLQDVTRETRPDLADLHHRLTDRRSRSVHHHDEMWQPRDPWVPSIFAAQGDLLALPDRSRTDVRFTGSVLGMLTREAAREVDDDLAEFVTTGGLQVRRGESAWSRSPVRTGDEVRETVTTLRQLTTTTMRTTRARLDGLLRSSGLRHPGDLDGWREILELCSAVAATVAGYGADVFGADLESLTAATADRRWRKAQGVRLGWWRRRTLVKQARALRIDGVRDTTLLHGTLAAAIDQRRQWQELSTPASVPAALPDVAGAAVEFDRLRTELAAIAASAALSPQERRPVDAVDETLQQLAAEEDVLRRMPRFNELTRKFTALGLDPLLDELATRDANKDTAVEVFRWAWLSSVLDELRLFSAHYGRFVGPEHTRAVTEFRDADGDHVRTTARRVRRLAAEHLTQSLRDHPDQDQLVRKQASLKRRHLSLRKLVERAPDVLLAARPCWAMSPLVVSRVLPSRRLFDVVVFDEASQVEPADAVTSIMRGDRLVVAGDNRQLPPTTFFRTALVEDEEDAPEEDITAFESILDRLADILPEKTLSWHYRSADERLIAFSNTEIYQSKLVTFPGALMEPPINHVLVDGVATPGQGGSAPAEVHEVVRLVLKHAAERSHESLGVIAMSDKHAQRIDMALHAELAERRDLDEFFADTDEPGRRFFVKNIERVQGDERDSIILSVGYAKAATGRLSHNFGPLNREGGERRLNVAVTRARRRMTVVSAFSHLDIDPQRTSARGAQLLRVYLEYAASGGKTVGSGPITDVELNPFETHVLNALRAAGLPVVAQYGVSGHRIDFALAHPDQPGRMVLAVEADGRSYHSSQTARDRDRLRQEHLERLGWRFHRFWSTDWFRDPTQQLEEIIAAWRAAVDATDRDEPIVGLRDEIAAVDEVAPPVRTAVKPPLVPGLAITEYGSYELVKLVQWITSDGLLRTDDQIMEEAMAELAFRRRGRKIVETLGRAIRVARKRES